MPENLLCFGDNAYFLNERRDLFPDESVDLIYLDPPFNSQRPYNILFKDHKGTPSAAQIKAFDDTWTWDEVAQRNYEWLITDAGSTGSRQVGLAPEPLRKLMNTFNDFLGHSEMFAYLVQMAARLVMLHRVLKKTGSLYLHCDPTASHYLKLVLDGIFGPGKLLNEIIWKRHNARSTSGRWPRIHDVLLAYAKTESFTYKSTQVAADDARIPHTLITGTDGQKYQTYELTAPGRTQEGESGKPWRGFDPSQMGRHWANTRSVMDEWNDAGLIHWPKDGGWPRRRDDEPFVPEARMITVGDVWTDIDRINQTAKERLGYPTQKPLELLRRIVTASSNPGDVVMDPFCGCGTTIDAVETLNRENPGAPPRSWIGIDITHLAINLIKHRLARFEPAPAFRVVGEPEDLDGARDLALRDRYQFQYWALGLIGARPAASDRKKGADKGIDGSFNFIDDARGTARSVLVQVKSGHVTAHDIRDLKGVLDMHKADMGVFITLEPPTKPMTEEAIGAGHYHSDGWKKDYPRIQILTIEELLADPDRPHPRCLRTPPRVLGETFKEGAKHRKKGGKQMELGE